LTSSALNSSSFSRNENNSSYLGGGSQSSTGYQNSVLPPSQSYLGGGNRNNYDDQKGSSGFGFNSSDRDNRSGNSNVYSTVNNGSQMLRPSGGGSMGGGMGGNKGGSGGFSNKILISNLPPTASYKMLTEKCNEFGDVQRVEDKGNSGILVAFATEWEAERAIKNMDRARIDGRTIDVRFFY